jgi:hypothetical protein
MKTFTLNTANLDPRTLDNNAGRLIALGSEVHVL